MTYIEFSFFPFLIKGNTRKLLLRKESVVPLSKVRLTPTSSNAFLCRFKEDHQLRSTLYIYGMFVDRIEESICRHIESSINCKRVELYAFYYGSRLRFNLLSSCFSFHCTQKISDDSRRYHNFTPSSSHPYTRSLYQLPTGYPILLD